MTKFVLIDSQEGEAKHTVTALQSSLDAHHSELIIYRDGKEALQYILSDDFISLVLTEYRLEGLGGLDLIQELSEKKPRLPTLLLSNSSDSSIAIKAVQAGAYDFLPKPVDFTELEEAINEALAGTQEPLELEPEEPQNTTKLIGNSRAMLKIYRDLAKVAATPVTVLIKGETGTGKELIAQALHEHGHRAHKPFIAVNCAAIPDNLLESELFGHERGAFSGAVSTKKGTFEQAHGATLFLDEIGDMQPLLQAKMLRVLQERTIQRVGGKTEIPVDVRVIAATHRNLEKMVAQGIFRADLLYRLNGACLKLPPLRDRLGDTAILTDYFLHLFGKDLGIQNPRISGKAKSFLARQTWPGNIRQLQNVLRQALLKRRELPIGITDLSSLITPQEEEDTEKTLSQLSRDLLAQALDDNLSVGAYREMLTHMEQSLLPHAMRLTEGNLTQAAKLLGLTRYTLREKLKGITL